MSNIKRIINILFLVFFVNCVTISKENNDNSNVVKSKNKTLPKECRKIYPDSNNVKCFTGKEYAYISLDFYKNIDNNGMVTSFQENKKIENLLFSLLYKEHIDFSKVTFFGGKNTMNIEILKKNKEKIKFNSGKKIELYHFYPKNSDKIYNFYKANQDIKIKFIGRDGKSYIVPVSEQHRKDLIELVDYYRMLTHKSE